MANRNGNVKEAEKYVWRWAVGGHDRGSVEIRTVPGVLERVEGVPNEEMNLIGRLITVKLIFRSRTTTLDSFTCCAVTCFELDSTSFRRLAPSIFGIKHGLRSMLR